MLIQSGTTHIEIIPPAPFSEPFAEEPEDYRYPWQHEINWFEWRQRADTIEKLQIFKPDKTIYFLGFLLNLTHGGDHINSDLYLQSHC